MTLKYKKWQLSMSLASKGFNRKSFLISSLILEICSWVDSKLKSICKATMKSKKGSLYFIIFRLITSISLNISKFLLDCKVLFKIIATQMYLNNSGNNNCTTEKYDLSEVQISTNFYKSSSRALLKKIKQLKYRNYYFWA